MDSKKRWSNRIRGWLPEKLYLSSSQSQASSKARAAYVVGYGVGIGICELLMLAIYTLGWGNFERSLSSGMDMLSNLVLVLPAVLVALMIGGWLSKKLQKRWQV
jgi:hypothetical protein